MPRRRKADDERPLPESEESLPSASPQPAAASRWTRAVAYLLLAGAVIVPVYVSPIGNDHFRQPKELLLYATVILAAATAAIGLTLGRIRIDDGSRRQLRVPLFLALAAVAWGVITTLASTNRPLSVPALIWGCAVIALFLLASYTLRFVSLHAAAACLFVPAIVNATVLLLQATRTWNPWVFPEDISFRATKNALLGNADDIGVYLAAPALLAFALTLTVKRFRILYALIGLYVTGALVATETLTAVGAFAAAVPLLLLLWRPRVGIYAVAILPFVFATVLVFGPTRDRVAQIATGIQQGRWGGVVSGRLVPFATAWQMFRARPLVGVGPGCYKFHYMRHYVGTREQSPRFFALARTSPVNFGETHNDHLQALAETGLPGYGLLLSGLAVVGLVSRRKASRDDERRFAARTLALPFAAMTAIIMLAQFPWQLAATAYTFAIIMAACLAWSHDDA